MVEQLVVGETAARATLGSEATVFRKRLMASLPGTPRGCAYSKGIIGRSAHSLGRPCNAKGRRDTYLRETLKQHNPKA